MTSERLPDLDKSTSEATAHAPCVDLYDDRSIAAAVELAVEECLGDVPSADAVTDRWSAARLVIDLLRRRTYLRQRFPHALSDAERGGFFGWLLGDGACDLGLTKPAMEILEQLQRDDPGGRVREILLKRPDVLDSMPLGFMPAQMRWLLYWLFNYGRPEESLREEEILWFALQCNEDQAGAAVLSYRFLPAWQRQFPEALTAFGCEDFARWLGEACNAELGPDFTGLLDCLTPAQQIRLAWYARPAWQVKFPKGLSEATSAEAFLSWLGGETSDITSQARDWCRHLDPGATARALTAPAANVLGHFCYPSGLRHSVQAIAAGLGSANIELSLRDVPVHRRYDEANRERFAGFEPYAVTLIHVQPEPFFSQAYDVARLHQRAPRSYRIAYWYWETETVPDRWMELADMVDEIWVPTAFIANAFRRRLTKPVYTLAPGVQLPSFKPRPRAEFSLPEDRFAFLFAFHFASVMERKNPLGLIRAFRMAFPHGEPVTLVLKTSFSEDHEQDRRRLSESVGDDPAIKLIDEMYSHEKTIALMAACDAFVSLHRSEGFGLAMAEAMLLGKPVIATGYSGNVDFMTDANSLLVDYTMTEVGEGIPVYAAAMSWAEPSIEHAAKLMRRLYEDRSYAAALGARAQSELTRVMSVEEAGKPMATRIVAIHKAGVV